MQRECEDKKRMREREMLDTEIAQLSKLRALKREVEWLSRRIAEMELSAQGGVGRITGLPGARRGYDRMGDFAVKIADLQSVLDRRRRQCMEELGELYRFIDDIADSEIRGILSRRYIEGMTWKQVAMRMGYSGEQIPRKLHNAFLLRNRGEN